MSSKKHSNATGPSSRGSASKRRMQLTSYLWKKNGMLWKNYGKAMEFLFLGSVRTLPWCPFICGTSFTRRRMFFFLIFVTVLPERKKGDCHEERKIFAITEKQCPKSAVAFSKIINDCSSVHTSFNLSCINEHTAFRGLSVDTAIS